MKNMQLKLKHQNGKTSIVTPIAFDYMVTHYDKPMYDEDNEFYGYETEHYTNVDISKLWDVQRKNNPAHPVSFEMFRCKIESKEKCAQLIESFNLYGKCIGFRKKDIVSEGELTFINKSTKTMVLGIEDTVNEMIFKLYNCVPTYMDFKTDNNIIGINTDFVETYISK